MVLKKYIKTLSYNVLFCKNSIGKNMTETLTNQIGEQLKTARLKKNLTLDDIQASTKIQRRYLEAIENNNLGILPGDFYVRAFIRQYAMAVGLNPEDLLGETPASISRTNDLSRAHRDNDGVVRAGLDSSPSVQSRLSNMLPTIWMGALIVVVLIAVWFVLTHLTTGGQQSNDNGNVSVSTTNVPDDSSKQASSTAKASSSSKKKPKKTESKLDLGTPEQNVALQTTIYNLSGQADKQHVVKISAQGAGTNVRLTAGDTVLLNEMVTGDKTINIPKGTTAVNAQFTNVTNAVMTFDKQKVTVVDTATPFWNVLVNLDN